MGKELNSLNCAKIKLVVWIKYVASHQEGSCLSQLEPGNSGYLAKTCVLD